MEALSSPANIAGLRARFANTPDGPRRRAADSVLGVMEQQRGQFVLMNPGHSYAYDSVAPTPRRAVVIFEPRWGSRGRICGTIRGG